MSFISIGVLTDITVTNFYGPAHVADLPGMKESQLTIIGNAPAMMKKATYFVLVSAKGGKWLQPSVQAKWLQSSNEDPV